jgi:argininosuccinate lyase
VGKELGQLSLEELRQFGSEFDSDFFAAVSLEETLDCHNVTGGTARERVRFALEDASTRIAALTVAAPKEEVVHVSA